jgi:hypothetical protein
MNVQVDGDDSMAMDREETVDVWEDTAERNSSMACDQLKLFEHKH